MEDLWVPTEEIDLIACSGEKVLLVMNWDPGQVPILFQLPEAFLLRWAEDDKLAGVPVELENWLYDFRLQEVRVTLFRTHSEGHVGTEHGKEEPHIDEEDSWPGLTLLY